MSLRTFFLDTFRHKLPRLMGEIREKFADDDPGVEVASVVDDALRSLAQYAAENPVDTLQRGRDAAMGITYLRKMEENDGHYAAMLDSLKTGLLSHETIIVPGSEDQRDIDLAQFVERNIENIEGTFSQVIEVMLDAVAIGFSIAEIVYTRSNYGDDAGRWVWKAIKDKDQTQFKFETDGFGNLVENGVIQTTGYGSDKRLPSDKFLIFTYKKRRGSIYGNGLGVVCSWYSWFKRDGIKSWLILLQKWANPTAIGTIPETPNTADKAQFQTVMNSICERSGITLPEGFDIKLLEATRAGDAGYTALFEYCNAEMSKRILGATLTSDTGNLGSYAQAKVHGDVRLEKIMALGADVSDVISEQAIKRLIDYNFTDVTNYPRFEFVFEAPLDRKQTAEALKLAQDVGVNIPAGWAHSELRIPMPADDEESLTPAPKPALHAFGGGFDESGDEFDEDQEAPEKFEFGKLRRKLFPREEQFADIGGISTQLDRLYSTALEQARFASVSIKDDILKQVEKKLVVSGRLKHSLRQNPIVVNVSVLRKAMINQAMNSWLWGQLHAVRELERMGFNFKQSRMDKFQVDDLPTPSQASVFFRNKIPITNKVFQAKLETERDRYFTVAGLAKSDIERTVQPLLLSAIENGDTFADFKFAMEKEMVKYTGDVYSGTPLAAAAGDKVAEYHLATVFRTNLMGAYNQGRMAIYNDPDVGNFIPWLQYSAILDEVTTEFCEKEDGRVYPRDDPAWDMITPPNHFNCFPSGTKVTTYTHNSRSRATKNIENIHVGDMVLTQGDEIHEVTELFERNYEGELVVIECDNGRVIEVTPNHPIYIKNRGWIEAGSIVESDELQELPRKVSFKKPMYLKYPEKLKADLHEMYIVDRKNSREIADKYGVEKCTITRWMKIFEIPIRSGRDAVLVQWENNDSRRKKIGKVFKEYKTNPSYVHPRLGKKDEEASKRMIERNPMRKKETREKAARNHVLSGGSKGKKNSMYGVKSPHGKGQWYINQIGKKIWLRSTWEVKVADYLTNKGLTWNYEPDRFYFDDSTYSPDFRITRDDGMEYFIEVKGWFHDRAKRKAEKFREMNPTIPLVIWDRQCMKLAGIL